MRYEFHPEAELGLYEAALRYEAEVPELGRNSVTKSNELSIYCSSIRSWAQALTRLFGILLSGSSPFRLSMPLRHPGHRAWKS